MALHLKHVIEVRQHLGRISEVDVGQRPLAEHVQHCHRVHRGAHAVPRDIDEVEDKRCRVEPVIAERVAPELR